MKSSGLLHKGTKWYNHYTTRMSAAAFKYRLGVSIHKVSDQNLHHEWQWLAVMTHSYLHELLMVGVDKHIIIYPNCGPWTITQNHYGVFSHISVCNGKTKAWCWLAWKRHLSMKQGSLFVSFRFVLFCFLWDTLKWDASDRVLGLFGKLVEEEGCMSLVSCRLDLRCKKYLNIEWFLHWKLN